MKRIYSLKGRNVFSRVYRKGKKIQGKGVKLFILKTEDFNTLNADGNMPSDVKHVKIGISIHKKFGNAVVRNRVKRRIRCVFSGILKDLHDGFCIIITPENEFRSIDYDTCRSRIISLLMVSGVLHINGTGYQNN